MHSSAVYVLSSFFAVGLIGTLLWGSMAHAPAAITVPLQEQMMPPSTSSAPQVATSVVPVFTSSHAIPIHDTEGEMMEVFASIPYWDQTRAVSVFKKNVALFDYVSVFWYRLDEDGDIGKYRYAKEDASLIEFAQENGVQVLALIANLPEKGNWDPDRVDAAIGSEERRAQHIADIVELAVSKKFDGINIDYEFLDDSQSQDFSRFIIELADALHKEGKILSVAIHAQTPGGETRGQDLVALQAADILSFMTYDEHWETGEPGPPASLPWVRATLVHAQKLGIDRKKIFMGIPLYGYDWPEKGNGWGRAEGIEYEDVVARANAYDVEVVFDKETQTPFFTYEKSGVLHEVWFENVESFVPKYELAKEFGVGGIMFWRQGREDERVYEALAE